MVSNFFIGTSLEIVSYLQWAIISQWISSHRFFHAATWDISCSVIRPIRLPAICDYHQTRSPLEKGLLAGIISHGLSSATTNCASSRHSILRLWRGPSPRAYSRGIISHGLSFRCGELCLFEALQSSPFGAALLQGPMRGSNAIKLSGRSSLAPHRGSCPKGLCKRTGFLGVKRRENPVRRHFERSEMRGLRSGIA